MLTPTQILEKMLSVLPPFEGAQTDGTVDQAILHVEANRLFRLFRTIEESSGQRFILTAGGDYLDKIGLGMNRPRFSGETDDEYRQRLIFSSEFWNDSTLAGIKTMIKNYYGIDLDNDIYDDTRITELYKQAACFWNRDIDEEGWVNPTSDYGAEWLGSDNQPGIFEVHLRAFQEGDEKYLKKRELYNKLMATRAAGILVFLYFHLDFWGDTLPHPTDRYPESDLQSTATIPTPTVEEFFDVTICHGEITKIVANAKNRATGTISRRLVHDRQKNKCQNDYSQNYTVVEDPILKAELEKGSLARRPEPFRFRQARMRNNCWTFFYNVKYEELDIKTDQIHTYYTRANPMIDAYHHYRGEDLHGMDFFSFVDYMEFWWRVSSVSNGSISVPSAPRSMKIFKIKESVTRFWWRVISFDGREISLPSDANLLEIIGRSLSPVASPIIENVDNWCIQIKNVVSEQISASTKDLVILERYNGDTNEDWERQEIARLKLTMPVGSPSRVVLARLPLGYMSLADRDIGVVSGLLQGPVDDDSVRIRYWLPEWAKALFLFIDKLIDQGFDGVLLDGLRAADTWVDGYPDADLALKTLIYQIANYARTVKAKDFILVLRGKENWATDGNLVNIIDGIVGEEVFFVGDAQQDAVITMNKVNKLSIFKQAHKSVLIMDYTSSAFATDAFIAQSLAVGFVPYITRKGWDVFSR